MSTSTPSPAIEQLPSNIPHLKTDSSNWAIFIMRFREAMQATCRWPYFKGTVSCPTVKDPSKVTDAENVTAGPEAALVASLVQRVAGGDAPKKEES